MAKVAKIRKITVRKVLNDSMFPKNLKYCTIQTIFTQAKQPAKIFFCGRINP
jgi:hypothetical protein